MENNVLELPVLRRDACLAPLLALLIAGCSAGDATPPVSEETAAQDMAPAVAAEEGAEARGAADAAAATAGDLAAEAVTAAARAAAEAMRSAGDAADAAAAGAGDSAREAVDAAEAAAREALESVGEAGSRALEEGKQALEEGQRVLEQVTPPAEPAGPPPEPRVQSTEATVPVTHTVVASITRFEPSVLFVQPGDTVQFTNMAGHNTESLEGLVPQEALAWRSALGENFSVTLEAPGAYVYKCAPHASAGMIAAIVVGAVRPANLESLEASPENRGMVGRTLRQLRKAVEAHTL